MATRLCITLYSIVTLVTFLRISMELYYIWSSSCHAASVVEFTCCSSDCSVLKFFDFGFCFVVFGDHMVQQYSWLDLTKELYAMFLVCSFFNWRFLLKNPNNCCAFDVTLFMCAFQVMLDEMGTPRYFAVPTD
jgi:hypothetical protein